MYIASNDIKKYMPHLGWKIYVFQNTLMTSHECGATLIVDAARPPAIPTNANLLAEIFRWKIVIGF